MSNINYVSISAIDKWSSNYTLLPTQLVSINGNETPAIQIKVDDAVSFIDTRGNTVEIPRVASVEHHFYQPTCIGGGCYVYGPNCQQVRVNTLKVGDTVLDATGFYVRITHVLKTMVGTEIDMYVNEHGLELTGYHPVMTYSRDFEESWSFPAESSQFSKKTEWTAAVYSFAVENGNPVFVNCSAVATLAHHEEGPVIGHEYFGSYNVLRDIERISADRYAVIPMGNIVRDPNTGKVIGIHK